MKRPARPTSDPTPEDVERVVNGLKDYGYHRDELFMTRALAKEAAALIEHLVS